jgi:hypothetical protein
MRLNRLFGEEASKTSNVTRHRLIIHRYTAVTPNGCSG